MIMGVHRTYKANVKQFFENAEQTVLYCRYSHGAHVIGDHLIVVGGVWLHSDSVPGVALINLSRRCSVEFHLITVSSNCFKPDFIA